MYIRVGMCTRGRRADDRVRNATAILISATDFFQIRIVCKIICIHIRIARKADVMKDTDIFILIYIIILHLYLPSHLWPVLV